MSEISEEIPDFIPHAITVEHTTAGYPFEVLVPHNSFIDLVNATIKTMKKTNKGQYPEDDWCEFGHGDKVYDLNLYHNDDEGIVSKMAAKGIVSKMAAIYPVIYIGKHRQTDTSQWWQLNMNYVMERWEKA